MADTIVTSVGEDIKGAGHAEMMEVSPIEHQANLPVGLFEFQEVGGATPGHQGGFGRGQGSKNGETPNPEGNVFGEGNEEATTGPSADIPPAVGRVPLMVAFNEPRSTDRVSSNLLTSSSTGGAAPVSSDDLEAALRKRLSPLVGQMTREIINACIGTCNEMGATGSQPSNPNDRRSASVSLGPVAPIVSETSKAKSNADFTPDRPWRVNTNSSGNLEEGWDAGTQERVTVLDYETKLDVERRIAFTSSMVKPCVPKGQDFAFERIFGEGEFLACGVLDIQVKGSKSAKNSRDNAHIFYCIEGAVEVTVHQTTIPIATGGMFMVPRGNVYSLKNIANRETKLFFAQGRERTKP